MTNDERRELAKAVEWRHGYQSQVAVELQRACDEIDALVAHVKRLRTRLIHIREYWNGEPEAAADAVEHAIDEAEDGLDETGPGCCDSHPDDRAADNFAEAVKVKMAESRDKGRDGWDDPNLCSDEFLADLLVGHLAKGNKGNLVDIGTLAMMLHQRGDDPAVLAQAVARRDARVKAEAMEQLAKEADSDPPAFVEPGCIEINTLEIRADEYRRQAEGEDHG